eukprot:TRINITY_DN3887_c0_g1_i3.p1 TRINITY_DN3887_c0_g1~~TRINITY_DN3887_c0_g1_i3.p1  ORF type:complete len:384 (-),score=67.46 TRINITY_DN3887_c0_g1_i3:533-1684(-)
MALVFEAVVLLAIVCIVLQVYLRKSATKSAQQEVGSKAFFSFQRNYLIVYYLAMGADWLQGPYVYALYETYGFQKSEIAQLFVGGFFSSMVFGTFVGSLADKYGRKLFSILYAVFYILACMTKWVPDYNILMIGRILSGISTSLLFCVFESWMVAEHNERKHPASLVGSTFSTATIGNGVVAIVAGLVASYVAENYGFVAPFMAAAVLLVVLIFAILSTWTENYGNTSVQWQATMTDAIQCIRNDRRISSLGLVQSLFEASMYTFVFMWTPTIQDAYEATFSVTQSDLLQVGDDNINGKFGDGDDGNIDSAEPLAYGTMFAAFMVSLMVGSSLFSIGIRQMSEEQIGSCVLPAAACTSRVRVYVCAYISPIEEVLWGGICQNR